jgi:LEA14-like dessication related protein
MNQLKVDRAKAFQRILIIFFLSIVLSSCRNLIMENPSFVLRKIALSPRSFTEMNLLISIEVHNPNRFDLTLRSFEYTLYLKNEEIGNGRLEKELLIPSSSTTQTEAPVAAKFKNLGGAVKVLITGEELPYRIEGKAEVKTFFKSYIFPFSKEGSVRL